MLTITQDVLLSHVESMFQVQDTAPHALPFAIEASWVTGKWDTLEMYLSRSSGKLNGSFNVDIGRALLALHLKRWSDFEAVLQEVRGNVAATLSTASTTSLRACHDSMLKLHALTEIEALSGVTQQNQLGKATLLQILDRRLDVLGAFLSDKQYLLGLRKATMQLSRLGLQ